MSNENNVRMDSNVGPLGKARMAARLLLGSPVGVLGMIVGAGYAYSQGHEVAAGLMVISLAVPKILDLVAKCKGKPADSMPIDDMVDNAMETCATKAGTKGIIARLKASLNEASELTPSQRKEIDARNAAKNKGAVQTPKGMTP